MIGGQRDEIADLGRDFDYMAGRLQIIISRQKQLIQDISHELRSPLARLHVAMELTRIKVCGAADRELGRIEREVNRLESLVTQILTLARLEDNKSEILDEHIDIAELLLRIVNDADYEAVKRDCHVHLNCKVRPILNANGELLLRALENIIRNAVNYTADSTSVTVLMQESEKHKEWLEISVCDHGLGVSEGQLASLFEPFVRIAKSRDRDSGGYGLGLSIAKRAIQLHGGHVSAHNREAIGLCVKVFLPLQKCCFLKG
jgi:signal transduction histidine kinase